MTEGYDDARLSRVFALGVLVWFVATLAFRFAGHLFFRPEPAWILGTFIIGGAACVAGGIAIRRRLYPSPRLADRVAIGLVAPGILLDTSTTLAFGTILPNLDPSLNVEFAALMLFGYGCLGLAVSIDGAVAAGPRSR